MYDDEPVYDDELLKMVESLKQEVQYLRGRVNSLETDRQMERVSGLPETWLLSPSLLKRAFGVYGLNLLAGFLVAVPFFCLYVLLMLLFLSVDRGGF